MGANGRRLVAEKYMWEAVVKTMARGYEGVVGADFWVWGSNQPAKCGII